MYKNMIITIIVIIKYASMTRINGRKIGSKCGEKKEDGQTRNES